MRHSRRRRSSGAEIIEFTLVGIPMIFLLIGIVEMARFGWTYTTLAHAVREGARYAVVHGNGCTAYPNTCQVHIQDIAARIRYAGVGLVPEEMQSIQFLSAGAPVQRANLTNCLTDATVWPDATGGAQFKDLEIRAQYRFQTVLALFWPGAGSMRAGSPGQPGTLWLSASSREKVQY